MTATQIGSSTTVGSGFSPARIGTSCDFSARLFIPLFDQIPVAPETLPSSRELCVTGKVDRGKRLARSNVIGRDGELAFERWALKHQLSANKAEIDLGVDFFCQVMAPVAGAKSMEVSGPILGAQVKTVDDNEDPRLKLDRIDATDLLRQTQATCLFGVLLSDESVHFQFLTKDFIDRLVKFLETANCEFTIAYGDMSDDGRLFEKLLRKYSNPFDQLQLRLHLIKGRVTKAISGAEINIEFTDEDTTFRIYVPSAASAFTIDQSAREQVRLKVLRGGDIDPNDAGVNLHPVILDALRETQSSALTLIGGSAQRVKVGITWQDQHANERFGQHQFGSEKAYVHRAGLRLTVNTKPEQTSDGYVHELESEVFRPSRQVPLTGNTFRFFSLFKPGAILSLPSGWNCPLSTFGDNCERIGNAIGSMPHLCYALGLSPSQVALSDIQDEEFARTSWFLEALLLKGIPLSQLARGFVVGPAADLPVEQIATEPISLSVPVVVNWKSTGIVIWVECDGEGFVHEGLLCGVRVTQQRDWKIEKTKRYEKSPYPELWITKGWPAIRIGAHEADARSWTFDPDKTLPLEATIKKIAPWT
jgi:hypothetical protein